MKRIVVAVILALAVALVGGVVAAGTTSVQPMCTPADDFPCGGPG